MLEGIMVRIWVARYVPRLLKFATFMDESVEKYISISSTQGGYKSYLKLQEKD